MAERGAEVNDSIIMENALIGAGAKLRRVIVDKNAHIPAGTKIGFDLERDREIHHVTESGIVVVAGRRSPIPITSLTI